ncbi:MAG: GNAT family N-acetyltransferase [Nocardioides sp.]|uniref:GNAT family N-acetyltransferase n=1 Tax=Nocardioides sp. TaxID=35761 RepID=UPI003D6A171B
MSNETSSVTREHDPDRYQIAVDDAVAGFTQFVDDSNQRIFFHTVVHKEYGGRGLGSELVRHALDETRGQGVRIVPVCPYVKAFLERHTEYADDIDPVTPRALELSREAASRKPA